MNENLSPNHVEVFIPLEQINPDEIQLDELMGASDEDNQMDIPQEDHLQPGFVQIFEPVIDPVFSTLHLGNPFSQLSV